MKKFMGNEIEDLNKKELLRLMTEYDKYVKDFEENSEGYPVCLEEFYKNDYQYILHEGDRIRFHEYLFIDDEDLHDWLMKHKSINFMVVEVDNETGVFWIEGNELIDNNYVKVRCPYAIDLYDSNFYRVISQESDLCKIFLHNEEEETDNDYIVIKDKNFEENISKLRRLTVNYETYQEIEDFIYDNFEIADIDTYCYDF